MKEFVLFIIALALIGIGLEMTSPEVVAGGELFTGRGGGRIEINLVEDNPHIPLKIQAASPNFFRLKSEDGSQLLAQPRLRPLGYFRSEYYHLNRYHDGYTSLRIVGGLTRIEFDISEVSEDQEIEIRYIRPVWSKILWAIGLLFIFCISIILIGPDTDSFL